MKINQKLWKNICNGTDYLFIQSQKYINISFSKSYHFLRKSILMQLLQYFE